ILLLSLVDNSHAALPEQTENAICADLLTGLAEAAEGRPANCTCETRCCGLWTRIEFARFSALVTHLARLRPIRTKNRNLLSLAPASFGALEGSQSWIANSRGQVITEIDGVA